MSRTRKDIAIIVLRLVLGLVVLMQSFIFLFGGESARFFTRHGLPDAIRLILGWSEVVAAILFLLPRTLVVGAWFLLVVFAGATLLHITHSQFEVGGLLVYSAAVFVVLAFHEPRLVKFDAKVSQ
jgi:putative oxidoreductase